MLLEKNKVYTSEGRGRKKCPGCQLIIGGVTKTCFSCGFDFISAKKEKDAAAEEVRAKKEEAKEAETVQGEKISPMTAQLLKEVGLYEAPEKLTSKEQAQRILSYGKKRATLLLRLAKTNHYWSHVDWNAVEEGLS